MVLEHLIDRMRQLLVEPAHGRVAVLEIARHRALASVKVERSDAVAGCGQRNCGVNCGRRLAGPALFIGEDDEMWLCHGLIFSPSAPTAPPTRRLTERGLGGKRA